MVAQGLETLIYEKKEGIAYVTLNRPERLNATNQRMHEELVWAWQDIRDDDAVHVVILTGAGEGFCVGRDLKDAAKGQESESYLSFRPFRYSWNTPQSPKAHYLFKPVIVAVNGICAPSGLEFVSEGDIILCSENATFVDSHVSVGVMIHSAVALAKRIGYNHVIRMGLMGRHERITAQRAYEIGLVTEVTSRETLLPRATEIAKTILLNSPAAVEASVEALWHSLSLGLRDAVQLDIYMQKLYNTHPDVLEGAKAFVERRKPNWKDT